MWIFTTAGFFSVVHKPGNAPDELTVRSRVRADLANLANALPQWSCSAIQETELTDYPYRCVVKREALGAWLAAQAVELDYYNFKEAVRVRQGSARAAIYHEVWAALLSLVGIDKSLNEFRRRFPLRSMRFPS